jgi:ribosomal protein S14|tara:strand:- start:4063 stop:4383 length:321 start_codon:yes stop_codon:yes gene_type:complete
MLSTKIRDLKTRNSFYRVEKLKKVKKFLFVNFLNDKNMAEYNRSCLLMSLLKKKQKLKIKTSVRISNNCIFNNRNKSVLRPYGISRILMRDLLQFGVLPGYSKAVW